WSTGTATPPHTTTRPRADRGSASRPIPQHPIARASSVRPNPGCLRRRSVCQNPPGRLSDLCCLIVGGTGGIGLATARRFLQESAWVVICGRSRETIEAATNALGDDDGRYRLHALRADAGDPAQVERLFEQALAWFDGRIDVLFHVAGISGRRFG